MLKLLLQIKDYTEFYLVCIYGLYNKSELQYAKLTGQIQHMKMQQPLISWTSEVAQRFARSGLFL